MIITARQSVVPCWGGRGEGENQSINLQDMKLSPNCIICYNFCYKLKQTQIDESSVLQNLHISFYF